MTHTGVLLALVLCLASCGGNSKSEVNVPTEYCEELVKLAEEGNVEAQSNLGVCYIKGDGVSLNIEEGVKWLKKAVEQNDPQAQFFLSMAYNHGQGVPQDFNESLRLVKESANQGFAKAQSQLAGVYDFGLMGISKDHEEAMKWFWKAAEQGDADGQHNVGLEFFGNGDYNEAFKWFEKSAAQGNAGALLFLGVCYLEGKGVKQNESIGYDYIKQSAELGNPNAIDLLKTIY